MIDYTVYHLLRKNKKGEGRGAYERGEAYLRGELHRGFTILVGREIHHLGLYKDLKGLPDVSWAVKRPKRSWFNEFFKNGCIVLTRVMKGLPFVKRGAILSLCFMVRSFLARSFHLIVISFYNIVRTFHESLSHKQQQGRYSCVYLVL